MNPYEMLNTLFTEEEQALIWAALMAYDVGPEDDEPEIYKELEERRKKLVLVFE